MNNVEITVQNIQEYRGALTIRHGDLQEDIWSIFDRSAFDGRPNGRIVPLAKLISRKNELLDVKFVAGGKSDPRQTAFDHMRNAAQGSEGKRIPLRVEQGPSGNFDILDGNATAQVLMLAGWREVPVLVENQ